MDKESPNYYAIIPAEVRYSDIPPNAKLLYGELTALTNKKGYAWVSNAYFAELYKLSVVTISRLISILEKKGFIECQYEYENNNNNQKQRKIFIKVATPINKNVNTPYQKCKDPLTKMLIPLNKNVNTPYQKCKDPLTKMLIPLNKNVKYNNTYNNTINNTSNIREEEIYVKIPCINRHIVKGKPVAEEEVYALLKSDVEDYKNIYKNIDVELEIKKMIRWLKDNPSKMKTKRGMPRFINGWLNRSKPSVQQNKNTKTENEKLDKMYERMEKKGFGV